MQEEQNRRQQASSLRAAQAQQRSQEQLQLQQQREEAEKEVEQEQQQQEAEEAQMRLDEEEVAQLEDTEAELKESYENAAQRLERLALEVEAAAVEVRTSEQEVEAARRLVKECIAEVVVAEHTVAQRESAVSLANSNQDTATRNALQAARDERAAIEDLGKEQRRLDVSSEKQHTASSEHAALVMRVKELDATVRDSLGQLQHRTAEAERTKTTLSAAREAVTAAHAATADAHNTAERAVLRISEARHIVDALNDRKSALTSTFDEIARQVQTAEDNLSKLGIEVASLVTSLEVARRHLDDSTQQALLAREKSANATKELSTANAEVSKLEATLLQLEAQLLAAKAEAASGVAGNPTAAAAAGRASLLAAQIATTKGNLFVAKLKSAKVVVFLKEAMETVTKFANVVTAAVSVVRAARATLEGKQQESTTAEASVQKQKAEADVAAQAREETKAKLREATQMVSTIAEEAKAAKAQHDRMLIAESERVRAAEDADARCKKASDDEDAAKRHHNELTGQRDAIQRDSELSLRRLTDADREVAIATRSLASAEKRMCDATASVEISNREKAAASEVYHVEHGKLGEAVALRDAAKRSVEVANTNLQASEENLLLRASQATALNSKLASAQQATDELKTRLETCTHALREKKSHRSGLSFHRSRHEGRRRAQRTTRAAAPVRRQ